MDKTDEIEILENGFLDVRVRTEKRRCIINLKKVEAIEFNQETGELVMTTSLTKYTFYKIPNPDEIFASYKFYN